MASGIERSGDATLRISLEFPDGKMREDFEVAFRGWLKDYQQRVATGRLAAAVAVRMAHDAGEEDVAGYLYEVKQSKLDPTTGDTYEVRTFYVDLIPGW